MPSVAILGTRGYPSYYGGFETAVRRLAPYLADAGWDVTVYGRPTALQLEDAGRDPRVNVVTTFGFDSKSASTLSYGLSATVDAVRRRPDVALVMNVANGFWLPMLKRAKIPTLVNVDGIEWERAKWGAAAKAVFLHGAKLTAKHATGLVFDAEALGTYWGDTFGRSGTYIPYGGELGPALDPPLGLPRGGYVLVVSRFVPENSIEAFFEAVPSIQQVAPVVIVGSSGHGGELDDRAATLAASFERVTWLGHVHDDELLHSLWQNCGVYFHGHSVGGTNPALVQAMASGAPVIARKSIYNEEVLCDDRQIAIHDTATIAKAIIEMMRNKDLRDSCSRRNQDSARQRFNWSKICSDYERELRTLIGAEARRT